MEIASDSPSRAIAEFWGRKGSGGSGLSLRFDRRYPDNEQRIATPVCVEKWPEANERDPAYHRKAETIPRGGGSFYSMVTVSGWASRFGKNYRPSWQSTRSKELSSKGRLIIRAVPSTHSIDALLVGTDRATASIPSFRSSPTTRPVSTCSAVRRVTAPVLHAISSMDAHGFAQPDQMRSVGREEPDFRRI